MAAWAALFLLVGGGCTVVVDNTRSAYDTCNPSTDSCTSGTLCEQSDFSAGYSCSTSCSVSADCPASPDGLAAVCVTVAGHTGQCYRTCNSGGGCPAGQTCGGPAGMTPFCSPGSVATTRQPYDACAAGDACGNGTTCAPNAFASGRICTAACTDSSQCPTSTDGFAAVCVITTGTTGQCHRTCGAGATCPTAETCGGPAGMTQFCFAGSPTTVTPNRSFYQACTQGADVCPATATCVTENTTVDAQGRSATFCTSSCTDSTQCPTGPNGAAGACVTASGASQCYFVCGAGNTCPAGYTCGGPTGMTPYCVPNVAGGTTACGHNGEACCAGNACVEAGTACGSDGFCGLAPYTGCAGSTVGAACLGGFNDANQVINTTCQRPAIMNPGPDGLCTAVCNSSQAECPVAPIPGRAYGCFVLQGATAGQCFVACDGGATCPTGTICVQTPSEAGPNVQICMPQPAA